MRMRSFVVVAILTVMFAIQGFAQDADFTPINVKLVRATYTKITIEWEAGPSATQAVSYKVLRDNTQIGTSATTEYTDDSLQTGTEYGYKIIAVSSGGENSPESTELEVKTIKSVTFDGSDNVEQVVDQLHSTTPSSSTALVLISAVKSAFESLLSTTVSFTVIDNDILNDFVNEELVVIQEVVPELTEAERVAAQAELDNLLTGSFGGNTFEHVYIHSKLTELGEKHWQNGHATAAATLYELSLNYLSDQETYVFNTLNRLGRFKLEEITETSTNAEIAAILHAHRDTHIRFFDFFENSISYQAQYAYSMPATEYFKHFSTLLAYSVYDQTVFANAQQAAQAVIDIEDDERSQKTYEKIDAWELINQKITYKDSAGVPVTGSITVKNITANTDKKYYFYNSEEAFVDERQFTVSNGEVIVPSYKGHTYETTLSFSVAGGNPIIFTTTGLPVEKGKVATYDNLGSPVLTDGTAGESESIFVVDHPTSPYNLTSISTIDVFTLLWDWANSASFTATHFKVFRGPTEIADVTVHSATNIPLDSPDGISSYTVVAYDASETASTTSPSLIVLPGDQAPYADYFTWMETYFGEQAMYSCDDPDGDGVNNYQEFIDGTDPTKIPGPTIYLQQKTYTKITLQWEVLLPGETGVSYKILRNDVEVGTSATTSFTDTGLTPGLNFTYKVSALRQDSSESELGTPLALTTMSPAVTSYASELKQIVDQFNPIDATQYTGITLVSAVKSGVESLLGTSITFTVIDNSLLESFVEEELMLIKEISPPMTDAERLTAQTELTDLLNNSFGGNSFEHVYIHSKLVELGEKHWQAGNKTAAKALYECSLEYLKDQETSVFNGLSRLARFELDEITDTSTNAEIITALNNNRDTHLRFFNFFEGATSNQALYAYKMPASEYFKYFTTLLTYGDYNQAVFDTALQLIQAAYAINSEAMTEQKREKIAAWELVPLKVNIKNADGTPLAGTIQIINVSAADETVKKVYYNSEEIPTDDRTYNFTTTVVDVPSYKGHLYNITVTVPNIDTTIVNNANYENGKKYIYTNGSTPAISTTGNTYSEIDFILDIDFTTDTDGDGIPDTIETLAGLDKNNPSDATLDADLDGISNLDEYLNGYDINTQTKVVYVDAAKADDSADGLTLANAKQTILGAVNISKDTGYENVIMVAAGTYTGTSNRNISFGGYDIKLRSIAGATTTIIDLEDSGRFLYLSNGESKESWLDGFTIKNGSYADGGMIRLDNSALVLKNNILENSFTGAPYTAQWGGALYSVNSNMELINNKFINNRSEDYGGAIAQSGGQMSITDCEFIGNSAATGGVIAATTSANLTLERCKFSRNSCWSQGAVFYVDNASISMTNCLVNNAFATNNYAFMYYSATASTVNIVNSTLYGFESRNNADMNINGILNVTNSIFRVDYSGIPTSVVNSITLNDCDSYGANNIIANPVLSGSGYPLATSPCLDAGTATGAPAKDMDGVDRPAGSGVDIGCYEFLDTDSDGIPDNIEIVAGMNKDDASDASGDIDGDGINNLEEYLNGTNPGSTDSDGDGVADNTELDLGYDPAVYTKVVYVDASMTDDTADGLTPATAKQTIKGAVYISKETGYENIIMVALGTYTGTNNKNISFSGYDIKLRSIAGAATTIIDLENSGRFLYLSSGESKASWLDGFTIKNGSYADGGMIRLDNSALVLKNNILENGFTGAPYTAQWGGALYSVNSNTELINNKFINNRSEDYGGAIAQNSGQMSITDCEFIGNSAATGGVIAVTTSANLTLERCKFSRNSCWSQGGVFYVDDASITMTNCLVNNAFATNNYAFMYYSATASTVNITNSTLYGFESRNNDDMNINGTLNITNSVFRVNFTGTPSTVVNSITLKDCNSYGANDVIADPQLNILGYPISSSPCLDAGTATGSPAKDIDGIARPAGAGIDIGCYEFLDTDSDGIPNNIETAAGLNPNEASDAAGDIDSDGISNLNEYLNGTNPGSTDSDGDNIADNTELDLGYNPAVYTKVVYVDASMTDDTADGLTPATAKQTIKSAVDVSKDTGYENVIMVTAGTYTGTNNKNLSFSGYDIKLSSIAGAGTTIVDLEGSGRFLYLSSGESKASWLDGFTIKNGSYADGGMIRLDNSALILKNTVLENGFTGAPYTAQWGGALYSVSSNMELINNKFINNRSEDYGGAIAQNGGQMSITDCEFIGNSAATGGVIAVTSSANLTLERCKFSRNSCWSQGAVFYVDNANISMTNCLVNDASSTNNYAFMYYSATASTVNIVNSTLYGFESRNNDDININGTLNVTNSVFRVNFTGIPDSIVNSITLKDCSTYGAGNIIADPQLNILGYPLAGSPCHDAGTATGAAAKDMDGVVRPAGSGVDIGCYEFLDTDSDGIPDNIEIAAGMNKDDASDASGDIDGDGINNLEEYLNGTDPGSTDSDGDNIADNTELDLGYDPAVYTKVVYVDAAKADDSADGLTLATAKQTILGAVNISKDSGYENVIMVAAGTYIGTSNKNISFSGYDIKLRSISGAATTIIDLENSGRFLYLSSGESKASWLDGFTVKNGSYADGGMIRLDNSALVLKNNILENGFTGAPYTAQWGGALYSVNSNMELINNKFINNRSEDYGGAIAQSSGQMSITDCEFIGNSAATGGVIAVTSSANLTLERCKFSRNSCWSQGAVFYVDNANINMTNCLVNNAFATNNYAFMYYSATASTVNIVNSTLYGFESRNGSDMNVNGTLNVTNSIFRVNVSGTPATVVNSCTLTDLSAYGAGNIIVDPQLNILGYPLAVSPCIDAGTATGSPVKDMDGVVRPAGSEVDIGCYEFLDTDSDGIPDNIEIAAGLNANDASDASGDIDGDGVSNLDEYLNGTNPGSTDSDGDGVADNIELELGYDPAVYTKVVYVDSAKADDSADGLTLATAKQTILGAVNISKDSGYENVIMVASGTYTGTNNKNISFSGYDIKLRSIAGTATTIIDLEDSGRFLYLSSGESKASWLDGFTIKNGSYADGGMIRLDNSALILKNNILENSFTGAPYTAQWGGALYSVNSNMELIDNKFINNRSEDYGGAIAQSGGQMSITDCEFTGNSAATGGVIAAVGSANLTLERCKFSRNSCWSQGAVFYVDNANISMTNCLVNDASSTNNYAFIYYSATASTVNIVNSTLYGFESRNNDDMNINGILNVTNSIFRVDYSGTPTSVVNSITLNDCDSYGANNVVANPQLNVLGSPLASSPCIDAGTVTGAPAKDMDGIVRPAGSGVDIGCYEFLDTDSDGIPDNIEVAASLDPNDASDASGDIDGDSVSNLDEYLNGTNPGSTDSDGDGVADNTELELGYAPAVYTKVVYVDASKADDSADGLTLANAKQTISAAVNISKDSGYENVIMVAAGTYTGTSNKNISFSGYDIKLRSIAGAGATIVDLENSGRFLYLSSGESKASWLDGFTIKNGSYADGGMVRLDNSALILKNNILENGFTGAPYTAQWGGALYSINSNMELINNKFINNRSEDYGGAIAQSGGQMSITDCEFIGNSAATGGVIAATASANLTLERCKISRNSCWSQGAVFYVDNANISMTNCLVNNAFATNNYAFMYYSATASTVNIINSTLYGFESRNNNDMNINGTLNVTNSVFRVNFTGAPTSIINSCTLTDMSAYGAGNIVVDPQLNILGSPISGSPCLDAGTATDTPAKDIDGIARPAGAGIDIGCYEFLDTDSDGIPDNIETAAGLNPNDASDTAGDIDSDGISNLDEYLNGTNPGSTDSDGDGVADNTELDLGYDPAVYTKVVYVDASMTDDTADGLTPATAKQTIKGAVDVSKDTGYENIIMVTAGTYTGTSNKNLSFSGYDIKLRSIAGAATTIIDLENSGRFLYLSSGESKASWLDGFTVKNGSYADGGMIRLDNSALILKNNILENGFTGAPYTAQWGGALYSVNSNMELINNKFINNRSEDYGGAIAQNSGQMSIIDCEFIGNSAATGGVIAVTTSANLTLERCKFSRNSCWSQGAVFYVDNANISMTNCLVNDASSTNNYAFMYYSATASTVNIVNSTLYGFESSNGSDMNVNGTLNVTNSIFRVNVSGTPTTVVNSCTLTDMSAHGAGNFIADPQLNVLSYPLAASPCIDAGTATGAPAKDMDGVVRPAGSGVDIGCYEFLDTDSDGIPNNIEIAAGLDPNDASDGTSDKDSDGLSNINEYFNGTNIAVSDTDADGLSDGAEVNTHNTNPLEADTDGDGLSDGVEITYGLNPKDATDAILDPDKDGLTNAQEIEHGTLLNNPDTDGDGIIDGVEILYGFNPTNAADATLDFDNDGVDNKTEIDTGYNPVQALKIVYVNGASGNDTNDGLTAVTAKKTIASAISISKDDLLDNEIKVAAGFYTGESNRNLDFAGHDIKLRSIDGALTTTIELEKSGRFLYLHSGETKFSWLDGFTIINGDSTSGGVVHVSGSALIVKNCVFRENKSSNGGVIYLYNSSLDIQKTTMGGNESTGYGGAVYSVNSTLKVDSSNFNVNSAVHGAAVSLDNTSCEAVNSSFVNNTATSRGGAFYISSNSSLNAVNCTMGYNDNDTIAGIQNDGSMDLKNCVITDTIAGNGTKVINYSCAPYDLSEFGTNNVNSDPLLTGLGCLLPGSPAIDAGTTTGAPTVDIIGRARPVGSGIDIGCEEFIDSDSDGISDYYESLCGGDVSPTGDDDGDGLTNLYEYQNGLNALKADTDGDGMNDKWEIDNNLNAIRNDARGDADGDGLLNIEEYEINSNPNSTDTDNDGKDDYWEAKEAFTDLNVADFDGTETTELTVTGNNYTNTFGGWEAEGTVVFSRDRSGWIEYTLNVPAAGTYQLEVEGTQRTSGSNNNDFRLSCYVNGGFSSRKTLTAPYGTNASARFFTPELAAGNTTVRLVWENIYRDTVLQINSIKLIKLGGPDTDSDGKQDWAESRLENMGTVTIPVTSKVSPVCIEGDNATFIEQIDITGFYTPAGETPVDPVIRRAAFNKWYTNVTLDPVATNNVSITVSSQDGALTSTNQITWVPTNVFTETEAIIIRGGDSLLLNAIPTGGVDGTVNVSVEGNDYDVTGGTPFVYLFENAGNITVTATYIPNVGETQTKNITVKVIAAAFTSPPAVYINIGRYWDNPNIDENVILEADHSIQFDVYGMVNGSRRVYLKADSMTEAYVDARIYKDGPIIDSTKISVIQGTTHSADGFHRILYTFEDGSVMYEGYVVLNEVPDDIEVKVNLWGSGTLFEDGTRTKTFTAANFSSTGELHYNILAPASFTTCQTTYLYQDGVLLAQAVATGQF